MLPFILDHLLPVLISMMCVRKTSQKYMKILSHHLLRRSTIILLKTAREGRACSSVAERLPSLCEALGLIPSTEKYIMQERKLVLLLFRGEREKNPSFIQGDSLIEGWPVKLISIPVEHKSLSHLVTFCHLCTTCSAKYLTFSLKQHFVNLDLF